jgi:hypothetical protein
MSYNGSGTFQINTSGQPVVAGTVISSTAFNALTSDLATGLSTAITKDGQTTTTVRIPFAAGINSTLVTDSTNTTSGSIITAGGVGIAKALFVGTTANIAGVLSTTSPNITTSITTPSTSFDLINATATTLNLGGAATAVNVGAATGTMTVANTTLAAKAITASTTLSVTGVTTVQAGTALLPAITTTGDTNTGIFFPAADTIAFSEGGVESMRIDSSGNVGIGTTSPRFNLSIGSATPSSTATPATIDLGATYSDSDTANTKLRLYWDGTNTYGFGVSSTKLNYTAPNDGAHVWYNTTTERMRIDSSGNVGIGTTSPQARLHESSTNDGVQAIFTGAQTATTQTILLRSQYHTNNGTAGFANIGWLDNGSQGGSLTLGTASNGGGTTGIPTERMRIDSSGDVCIGKTSAGSLATNGIALRGSNDVTITTDSAPSLYINRNTNDGPLVQFRQANTEEGSISVSGTTVSYNGGHLSRWAQMLTKPDLLKGTVMSNLDEMNVYTDADGNPVDNEQLNKVKVSDVEGDANVAGVFVNWSHDDAHDVDEINMAMTGDMIIRIAQGTTVQRGDLLMSAGDGTAKPQGDDIVRSKTVAKVTSTHVTCTYADGSFCVPCVLMAC